MNRVNIFSGSLYEKSIGFSRAVRVGNSISVSGTAPISPDGSTAFPDNVYEQTKYCIELIKKAVEEAGGTLDDVIRTRIMLKDVSMWKEAVRAHGEYFSQIRPACTLFEVKGFVQEDWLVEIEAECIKKGKDNEHL